MTVIRAGVLVFDLVIGSCGGIMFSRLFSLAALIMLVGGFYYILSTADNTLDSTLDEVTFDCEPGEEKFRTIEDSAGRLRRAAGLSTITDIQRKDRNIVGVYRFTWERSFHEPVVMTLQILKNGSGDLHVLVWNRNPAARSIEVLHGPDFDEPVVEEPDPLVLLIDEHVVLMQEAILSLVQTLEEEDFWGLTNFLCGWPGIDGSNWTIEGASDGNYQYVRRWTPRNDSARRIGDWFISSSGIDFGDVY